MGCLSKSVKKGKFMTETFYSNIVKWSSKNFRNVIPADVKVIKTKRNKRSGGGGLLNRQKPWQNLCVCQQFLR